MARLKIIFLLTVILMLHNLSAAQNFKAQLLGGMNVAQVDGDSYGGYNQPGILGGISIYREANPKYNYGFELLYSQKGSHKKTNPDDPLVFRLRFTYLCMPLFVEFKELGISLKKLTIRAAVSPNFNITSKVDYGYGWQQTSIKRYEVSGIVGINYKFSDHLGIMLRHENSILSVGKPPASPFYTVSRRGLYNRLVTFAVSYDLK